MEYYAAFKQMRYADVCIPLEKIINDLIKLKEKKQV